MKKEKRRVGNAYNPLLQEYDWLEPEDVGQLNLNSEYLELLGHPSTLVEFVLSDDELLEEIVFTASCIVNHKEYKSTSRMSEIDFANELFETSHNQKIIEDSTKIKSAKNKALSGLQKELTNKGVFMGQNKYSDSIGAIFVDDKMIGIFSDLNINVKNAEIAEIQLGKIVSNIDVTNIEFKKEIYYLYDDTCIKVQIDKNFENDGLETIGEIIVSSVKTESSEASKIRDEKYDLLSSFIAPDDEEQRIIYYKQMLFDQEEQEEVDPFKDLF